MSTCLGVDPGTATVGWFFLPEAPPPDWGSITVQNKRPWPQTLRELTRHLGHLLEEKQPDVVAIEATLLDHSLWEKARQDPSLMGRLRAQTVLTQRTEELAAAVSALAAGMGAHVERVTPYQGLKALGLQKGATDRQASEAANRLFGTKLLVREHHIARAAGVCLRGQ